MQKRIIQKLSNSRKIAIAFLVTVLVVSFGFAAVYAAPERHSDEYHYYIFLQELKNEAKGGHVTTNRKAVKHEVEKAIVEDKKSIQYCHRYGVKVSNAEISRQEKKLEKEQSRIIPDNLVSQVYGHYHLNSKIVKKYRRQHANALACRNRIRAKRTYFFTHLFFVNR